MSRYIDADKLCEGLKDMAKYQEPYKQSTILGVVGTIKNTRTADVVEVRHGEWKKLYDKAPRYVCTACNHLYNNREYKFCPNCGAKMDGERSKNGT